jgi:hypothetical protein
VNAARIRWNFRTAFPRDVEHEVDEKHEAITSAIGGLTPWSAVIYQVYPRSFGILKIMAWEISMESPRDCRIW